MSWRESFTVQYSHLVKNFTRFADRCCGLFPWRLTWSHACVQALRNQKWKRNLYFKFPSHFSRSSVKETKFYFLRFTPWTSYFLTKTTSNLSVWIKKTERFKWPKAPWGSSKDAKRTTNKIYQTSKAVVAMKNSLRSGRICDIATGQVWNVRGH